MGLSAVKLYCSTMLRNARFVRFGARAVVVLLAALAAGCADTTAPTAEPPAEFVAMRRAWRPGERDSLIAAILTDRRYTFPYVGDISDLAPQLYADTDSVSVVVPNPMLVARAVAEPGIAAIVQYSATWDFVASKITSINNVQRDTTFWHMVMWSNPADKGSHGFAIAFSRNNTFNISPINTANFDAAFGRAGAAAGEFHQATNTYWQDNAAGGSYQVTAQSYPGAFSTVTTGPYLGGLSRAGTQYGRVRNSAFVRLSGTETPANYTVNFDYRTTGLPSVEIQCVFPTPCTTNALMAQRRAVPPAAPSPTRGRRSRSA